ncbi:MAG: hypothetical protein J7L75_02375 [Thermoproteales archaeon]|nr:hypothetical protein [Thermoproteales archaeon]
MFNLRKYVGMGWQGLLPASYLLRRREFKRVVLEPPDYSPGSWRGAGKVLVDAEHGEYLLTCRPRRARPIRGYAVEIYQSRDGEGFNLVATITKEELSEMTGLEVRSIEGQQLLLDPATGRYHLYLAVDNVGSAPVPGWDTLLLTSDDPRGPWESKGLVIRRGPAYDCREARDATIDIIDGVYLALYKANDGARVNMALAVSNDGVRWRKLGVLKLGGGPQPAYLLLCGKILAGSLGPIFVGFENRVVIEGAAVTDTFSSYLIDLHRMSLVKLFSGRWEPKSPYEHERYPVHSYCDVVPDPLQDRVLIYVEAIDPRDVGLDKEVDRLLLYEVSL